jgi:hypothetical protein
MKNIFAVSAMLLATAIGVSSCAPASGSHDPYTPISISPDGFTSSPKPSDPMMISNASLSLQTFFATLAAESKAINTSKGITDYKQIKADYPATLKSVDGASLNEDETTKLFSEYTDYISVMPNDGYVGISPNSLKISVDGTIKVTGDDLFVVYKEDGKYITHKGVSMSSDQSLNDVFTMSEVDGEWRITGVTL